MKGIIIFTAIIATLLAVALPRAYSDYQVFLSYGPGGIPYNVLGWLAATLIIRPFAREPFSTTVYEQKIHAGETTSFLSDETVITHKRDRPVVGPHIVPHRQLTECAEENIRKRLIRKFEHLAVLNPDLVRLAPSRLELHAKAIFLLDGFEAQNPTAKRVKNEIVHIHRLKDASLHATLAPADCKKLVDAGWAQRHGLSGVYVPRILTGGRKISLPAEYLLIYAPRTEKEIDFVMEIVSASIKYVSKVEG